MTDKTVAVAPLTRVDLALAMVLATAMLAGGGSYDAPLAEWAVQLTIGVITLALAAALVVAPAWRAPMPRAGAGHAAVLALVLLALPLLQLVPLPPTWWHALPGRGDERAALDLIGAADRWMPLSMAPTRTLAAILALGEPAAVLLLVGWLSEAGVVLALAVVVVVGLMSVTLGTVQVASGTGLVGYLYRNPQMGFLAGFQSNRNAEADVLALALLATGWLTARLAPTGAARVSAIGALVVLTAGVVMAGSRTGLLMLGPVLALVVSMVIPVGALRRRTVLPMLGLTVLTAAVAVTQVPALARIAARFANDDFGRRDLWIDAWYGLQAMWPWGAGLGLFVPVFVASERLETIDAHFPNRAHNDYLELLIEGGVPALVWLALLAGILVLGWRARCRRGPGAPDRRATGLLALGTGLVIALHSLVEYPLRSTSLACLAALVAGLAVTGGAPRRTTGADAALSPVRSVSEGHV